MNISEKDVIKTAFLARIKVSQEERAYIASEITKILNWIDQLNEVDVNNVELYPDYHYKNVQMTQRKDQITEGNCPQDIVANAPDEAFNMFSVPKVVE